MGVDILRAFQSEKLGLYVIEAMIKGAILQPGDVINNEECGYKLIIKSVILEDSSDWERNVVKLSVEKPVFPLDQAEGLSFEVLREVY